MTPDRVAFGAVLRTALAGRDAAPNAMPFAAPLVTAILADAAAGPLATFAPLLAETIDALASVGVPRGRQFVLFVLADGTRPAIDRAAWREALGVPVLVHDPAGTTFPARTIPPPVLELDDELREAEAIVTVGPASAAPGSLVGGPLLLCPGAAGARTVTEWRRLHDTAGLADAVAYSLDVARHVPVDLAVTWNAGNAGNAAGDSSGRVVAAPGSVVFAALARDAGWG